MEFTVVVAVGVEKPKGGRQKKEKERKREREKERREKERRTKSEFLLSKKKRTLSYYYVPDHKSVNWRVGERASQ
jgi:hypothetical protein